MFAQRGTDIFMVEKRCRKNFIRGMKRSKGFTMVEMIVTFALLSIFMLVVTAVVSNIVNSYYRVKGETYAYQVADILSGKLRGEIEGAKYNNGAPSDIPVLGISTESLIGDTISLYDKTDTHVKIGLEDRSDGSGYKDLYVHYFDIVYASDPDKDRNATVWKFDESAYNGFGITELRFAKADKLGTVYDDGFAYDDYMARVADDTYPENVIAVFMTLKSPKYGEYHICRMIKMYNFPE